MIHQHDKGGPMELWSHCIVEPLRGGVVEPLHRGVVEPLHRGAMELWSLGPWSLGAFKLLSLGRVVSVEVWACMANSKHLI